MAQLQLIPTWLVKPLKFGISCALICLVFGVALGEPYLKITNEPIENNIALVLVLDTSDSMKEVISGDSMPTGEVVTLDGQNFNVVTGTNLTTKLDEVKQAMSNFLSKQPKDKNEYTLLTFGSDVNNIISGVNDPNEVRVSLDRIKANGSTAMDKALRESWNILEKTTIQKKAILLFTDGLPDNELATLEISKAIRRNGIMIVAIGTSASDEDYLETLTGNKELFFNASDRNFDKAFKQAGNAIKNYQLLERKSKNDNLNSLIRVCVWTIILATAISLSVTIVKNLYLKRRIISKKEIITILISGILAGTISGASGQLCFLLLSNISEVTKSSHYILVELSRIIGWTTLGAFLGGVTSAFLPNLRKDKSIIAGTVGGLLAGCAYVSLSLSYTDTIARLTASVILGFLLGAIIVVIEQLSSNLYLILHWSNNEKSRINLGKDEILIGSSPDSHIYLSKKQGFPSKTAKIYMENDKVIIEFSTEMQSIYSNMQNLRQEFNVGTKRKLGNVIIELVAS